MPSHQAVLKTFMGCHPSFSQSIPIKIYQGESIFSPLKVLAYVTTELVSLMLLSAYPEMVDNLNIDKLMDAFVIRNDARRNTFSM